MNFQDVLTSGPTACDLRPFIGVMNSVSAYSLRVRCRHILYSTEHRSPNPRIIIGHLLWEGTAALPFWAFVTLHSTSQFSIGFLFLFWVLLLFCPSFSNTLWFQAHSRLRLIGDPHWRRGGRGTRLGHGVWWTDGWSDGDGGPDIAADAQTIKNEIRSAKETQMLSNWKKSCLNCSNKE